MGARGDAKELKDHPFFDDVDWDALLKKNVIPPFKPTLRSETDTSYFDTQFTDEAIPNSLARTQAASLLNSTPLSPTMQENFRGFTFVNESSIDDHFVGRQLDRMDEDEDEDWEENDSKARSRRRSSFGDDTNGNPHRMSGVQRTGPGHDGDEGLFNHDFDM